MNHQVPHDKWVEKIIARDSGELSSFEASALDRHLSLCRRCALEAKKFKYLANQLHPLRHDASQRQLPPAVAAFKQEVAEKVAEEVKRKIQKEAETIVDESFSKAERSISPSENKEKSEKKIPLSLGTLSGILLPWAAILLLCSFLLYPLAVAVLLTSLSSVAILLIGSLHLYSVKSMAKRRGVEEAGQSEARH
jgi:hypothetical protein